MCSCPTTLSPIQHRQHQIQTHDQGGDINTFQSLPEYQQVCGIGTLPVPEDGWRAHTYLTIQTLGGTDGSDGLV